MTQVMLGAQTVQVRVTSLSIGGLQAQAAAEAALTIIAAERAAAEAAEAGALDAQENAETAKSAAEVYRNEAGDYADAADLARGSAVVAALAAGFFVDASSVVPEGVAEGATYWTDHPTDELLAALYLNDGGIATAVEDLSGNPETYVKSLGFLTDGEPGDIYTQLSASAGPGSFVGRPALSDQPSVTSDLTTSGNRQMKIPAGLTNPGTRITMSVVSGKLRLTSNLAAVFYSAAFTGRKIRYGDVITGSTEIVTTAGTFANWGFGIVLSAVAPSLGSAAGNLVAADQYICMRANGNVQAFTGAGDGSGVDAGVTITGSTALMGFTTVGQTAGFSFRYTNEAETEAEFVGFIDGVKVVTKTLTGVKADAYYAPAIRTPLNTAVADFNSDQSAYTPSLDVPLRAVLDPTASSGGSGSALSPFSTSDEAVSSISRDRSRREVELRITGAAEDFMLDIDATDMNLRIVGEPGVEVELSGAQTIPIGASWTFISNGVYAIDNPGRAQNLRGIIQMGRSQTYGRNGETVIEGKYRYTVLVTNTAAASILENETSSHISGTYDGKTLVRMPGDTDPADYEWRIPSRTAVIKVRGNGGKLSLQGLKVCDSFNYGIQVENMTIVDSFNCEAGAIIAGFGFDFKDCTGSYDNFWTYGSSADGHHFLDTAFTDEARLLPSMTVNNSGSVGLDNNTVSGTVGDGASPHFGNRVVFNNFTAISCGKDGLSMAYDGSVFGLYARDNVNAGLSLSFYEGHDVSMRVKGITSIRNLIGATLNGGAGEDLTGELEIDGFWGEDNGRSHVETFATGAGTELLMTVRNGQYLNTGAEPTEGNVKDGAPGIGSATAGETLPSIIVKTGAAL